MINENDPLFEGALRNLAVAVGTVLIRQLEATNAYIKDPSDTAFQEGHKAATITSLEETFDTLLGPYCGAVSIISNEKE